MWHLPDNPPPALALCTNVFQVKRDGKTVIEANPITFLMQSRPGVLQLTMHPPERHADEDAALLKVLQARKGDRTDEVQALERMLQTKPGET